MGIILGVVVILLIIIFSLGYQLNKTYKTSLQESVRRIKAEEKIDELNGQINGLKNEADGLKIALQEKQDLIASKDIIIEKLEWELIKLNKLKEQLEENLKDELVEKMESSP